MKNETPLYIASKNNSNEMFEILKSKGAEIHDLNDYCSMSSYLN